MRWTEEKVEALRQGVRRMSYTSYARLLGISRGAVSGAVHRHILGYVKPYNNRAPIGAWDEGRLTEPYTARKLRLQKERAAARATTPQVSPTGQDTGGGS